MFFACSSSSGPLCSAVQQESIRDIRHRCNTSLTTTRLKINLSFPKGKYTNKTVFFRYVCFGHFFVFFVKVHFLRNFLQISIFVFKKCGFHGTCTCHKSEGITPDIPPPLFQILPLIFLRREAPENFLVRKSLIKNFAPDTPLLFQKKTDKGGVSGVIPFDLLYSF